MLGALAVLLPSLLVGLVTTVPFAALHYEAAAGCPSALDFSEAVLRRASPDASAQISARIEAGAGGFSARLEVRRSGEPDFRRTLTGRSCAEAVNALALVCALALEAPPSEQPAVTLSSSPTPEEPEPPPAAEDPPTAPEQAPAPRFDTGLHFAVDGEASPFFGVHLPWPLLRLARLSFSLGTGESPPSPIGTATYTRMLVRLDACPIALEYRGLLELFGCGRLEGGPLVIRYGGESTLHPLASAGLIANARWLPSRWFFVELQGGALYALARKQAQLGGAVLLPDPPALSPRLALGVGLQIP